ncbi:3-deoxy-D-manno-octulosonic acid transferase [Ramlibacter solisilvae]|uniref:3-deoxy-D-manno-octulosonic acid transferase n=1 Tax=Ramlibacter tataouinensis TaxID=94132 RepID=A0A127JWI7_9BURK|nr:3-deoxy-D-manno-octulosonic acid transferase [Ramlibacter tataouinensis]AMO24265.1 3-deoxy-D-manno-octulosonic acid transferase [Ramlibacter tataouinensis]
MIRPLYTLAVIGAQPLLRRKLRRRGAAEPGYLQHVDERFGRYEDGAEPGALWIHAVSLGETRAAAILIAQLRALQPGIRILLTHGTATGRAEGERLLRDGDRQAWLPWDTPKAVRAFLNHFRPSAGVLMETEVWPNLVAVCRQRGVPLALANARLSQKSLAQARQLAFLSRPAYSSLTAVWAQTEGDARRLTRAGATVQGVFGNLKFDATPDAQQLAQGRRWREGLHRPVVMFASSREGEEAEFFRLAQAMRGSDAQWLVVPRHPQRFAEVAALAASQGLSVSRRSAWGEAPARADVWIGDSLGEMALYYGLADVALLGGSFEKLGGQNLIEAAACGCPVVMGPHTFNFAEASRLAEEAGAALRVASMEEGMRSAVELAGNRERHTGAVRAGLAFAEAHQGAARRTAEAILELSTEPGR